MKISYYTLFSAGFMQCLNIILPWCGTNLCFYRSANSHNDCCYGLFL